MIIARFYTLWDQIASVAFIWFTYNFPHDLSTREFMQLTQKSKHSRSLALRIASFEVCHLTYALSIKVIFFIWFYYTANGTTPCSSTS